jgi:hypothetical protein
MLRTAMHRSRRSFKATLNAALRDGLSGRLVRRPSTAFVVKARPMGARADVDPTSFNPITGTGSRSLKRPR